MLSESALKEFQEIWKDEVGTEISDDKALEEAIVLLSAFHHVYRPIKKDWVIEGSKDT